MEYFFSNQLTDETEFDSVDAALSADLPTTADDQLDDDYSEDANLEDFEMIGAYVDDDEMAQFTLSTLQSNNVDDMERDDDYDGSEGPFTEPSFEPDLPLLASSFYAPAIPTTGRDTSELALADHNTLSLPIVIAGAALALTALVVYVHRRSDNVVKKGNKGSYNLASSPSIKRDLVV